MPYDPYIESESGPDTDTVLLIVVGAHLIAELSDRPCAYQLAQQIVDWQQEHLEQDEPRMSPIVCSDMWYINSTQLMARPTICLGRPGVNAASAYFANRLPIAFVIEHSFQVQLDVEFLDMQVCIWGIDSASTSSALEIFRTRYFDSFLRAAHDLPAQPA